MVRRRSVLVPVIGMLMVGGAAAQQPPADGATRLTVAQAIDEAIAHNLNLLAQRANLTIADAAVITAKLRPNPVASFSADHLDWLGTGFDETNNGGPPEVALRVDVPIERGAKREKRMEVASLARTVAEAQLADAIRTLRNDVVLACLDVIAAREQVSLVRDNLRAFEELARVNRARVVAGSIAPFESTRSDVAMLQFRSTVVRAELELAGARARLSALLGRQPTASVDVAGELRPAAGTPIRTLQEWQDLALRSRPDLRALELSQARSAADIRLQEANGHIDYSLGAEYRRQQGVSGRSNSVGLFVSAPLPLSNRNQGEIARANAERDQVNRQIAALRAQVTADVDTAYREYTTNADLVTAIEADLLQPAAKARDISAYSYRAGGTSLLELLDAQRAFNDTMQSYLDAQASLGRAVAHLNAAVGMEVVK